MRPIRAAPAVWELEGPIITGPRMSNTFICLSAFLFIFAKGYGPGSWRSAWSGRQPAGEMPRRLALALAKRMGCPPAAGRGGRGPVFAGGF